MTGPKADDAGAADRDSQAHGTSRPPRRSARTKAVEAVATRYFDALVARDTPAMAAFWHAEGVEDQVPTGILRGPEGVKGFFDELFAALPDMEYTVDRITAGPETAAVQWRGRGTFDGGPFAGVEPTGRTIELRGVDVLEVDGDGAITRNTVYFDGAAFARGAGMLPSDGSAADRAMKTAFNGVTKLRKVVEGLR